MQAPRSTLELRDIHLPDAIGWWPPAVGWWLLLILIPLAIFFIIWLYKRITRQTAKKTAKKLLVQLKQNNTLTDAEKLAKLSQLIRRVAISISPRADAASLTGQSWLEHLDSTVAGTPFSSGVGKYLADAHFQKKPLTDIDITALISLSETWLKAQKPAR